MRTANRHHYREGDRPSNHLVRSRTVDLVRTDYEAETTVTKTHLTTVGDRNAAISTAEDFLFESCWLSNWSVVTAQIRGERRFCLRFVGCRTPDYIEE